MLQPTNRKSTFALGFTQDCDTVLLGERPSTHSSHYISFPAALVSAGEGPVGVVMVTETSALTEVSPSKFVLLWPL